MINQDKPTTTYTNADKAQIFETWASIATTWATETRTWLDMTSIIENAVMSLTDPLWSSRTFPWQLSAPWHNASTGITNVSKP